MSLSRRAFIRLGGLATAAAASSGCSVVGRELARRALPETLSLPPASPGGPATTRPADPVWRLLNRAGFGPRPGDFERASARGFAATLAEQLAPESIDDDAADLMIRHLTLYPMDVDRLLVQEPRDAAFELIWATTARALYSRRQLFEVMVGFWSDHFNIYLRQNRSMPLLKLIDDRDVIRPHALGKFRDLLFASARSPAMLTYLDNSRNTREHPNENYARELMELHTLGVDGGYTQRDVQEVARALTGWTVARRGRRQGQFVFRPEQHDNGAKEILGHQLPAGQGEADVTRVLEILAAHPATARFLATKLVRRFVADPPPTGLVDRVAQTYRDQDGEVRAMLQVIFESPEFAAAPLRLKRPFDFTISALRAVGADVGASRALGEWMVRLGQPLFQWPSPDGYPDTDAAWASNLLPRWNFALALVHGRLPRTRAALADLAAAGRRAGEPAVELDPSHLLSLAAGVTLGRDLSAGERAVLQPYVDDSPGAPATRQRLQDAVALMLAGPAFQWR